MKFRLLFLLVVTPLAVLGRPLWRRRVGLGFEPGAASYWRRHATSAVTSDALRRSS